MRQIKPTFLIVFVVLLVFAALLGLDLANRGLAWQFFCSQTGEEAPVAQLRGMVELLGNFTRQQPHPDPLIPVNYSGVNPYGINTFLQKEVEAAKVDKQLEIISAAGFKWIRQEFVWEDIEVDGRGQFTDSRNDMDGDGDIDTIDGWAKYDRIVDLAEKYDVQIQARLSNPPQWAQREGDNNEAPPADYQDFVNFAVATAEQYKGRITHYQIWNEPNIYPEWGENTVNPEAFKDMLCQTYAALKAVDPNIVVISPALASTNELGGRNLSDLVYWQRLYDAGGGACFDVLAMQGYGLNSGPTDQRMRPTTMNFSRIRYIRDLMVKNGDAHKPIWISEAAWNFVPDESEYPEPIEARYNFGQVTKEQAAEYMPLAYQRIQQEFPYVGVMNYWFFSHENDSRRNQSVYYFRMVEPDYSSEKPTYTPLPVYDAMKDYINNQTPVLYQGVHQLDQHWAVQYGDESQVVEADGAQFEQATETTSVEFVAHGTDVRLRSQGNVRVLVDGVQVQTLEGDIWSNTTLHHSLTPETHTFRIESDSPILLDSVTIIDNTVINLLPYAVIGLITLFMLIISIGVGLRGR